MNDNDDADELFLQEMADVKPLEKPPRVPRKAEAASEDSLLQRRQAATATNTDPNHLRSDGIDPLDAWYVLDFKRPGIQDGVFRKLKQGRYEADARLDLHRMTVERARREIYEFVEQAVEYGLRSVLIIHGKGQSNLDRPRSGERENLAVLKGYTRHWLEDLDAVQAFHSARPQHGGTGAVYVLLRKSEASKRENRLRFNKGRSLDSSRIK